MSECELKKLISAYIPLPVCIINRQGKVIEASSKIGEVFLYDGIKDSDIFALTGVKTAELYEAADKDTHPMLRRNDKIFRLMLQKADPENEESNLTIVFDDVTGMEELKDRYRNEKPCFAKVQIDNYDELTSSAATEMRLALSSDMDRMIRKWASRFSASVNRVRNNSYVICFEQQHLDKMAANKFDILDEIRGLETGTDFPASLSIGVGVGGKTPAQTEEYADAALDLALGRGGDQAVVKRNLKIEYFGGKLQTVEKSNKGKSRIVGHALKQLVKQSRNVFIMGHKNPDMDSFGAALGIFRFCEIFEKKAYIVIEDHNEALQAIYLQARKSETYQLVSREKAISMADSESLVIVVDTHRPSMTECPQLLTMTERVVVIDHHRKMEEFIENPTLAYMESYASSTCELVTEILLYMGGKKSLVKLEAEALLAGMTIDTNGFAVRTGVRTFEAAAWLRRQGADPTEVKRFFQKDPQTFQINAQALASARFFENGMALSICEEPHADEQVICAQVADQLLTVKGVRVSFVIGTNGTGKTVVSARSLGAVNVQVIMERFGGGGHLTMAATQLDTPKDEVAENIIKVMEEYLNDSHS
ncbi:MAG: DHH family phosphoesterase [Firmicutes bacterium]|nr:DHH family phosphoesterase [Bacillota bacterium]